MRPFLTYRKTVFLSVLFLITTACGIIAQDVSSVDKVSLSKLKRTANYYIRRSDYYSAIDFLEKYLEKKPDKFNIKYQLAELYRYTKQYDAALETYSQIFFSRREKYPLSAYYMGTLLMNKEKYEDASDQFSKFRRIARNKDDLDLYRRMAFNHIKGCELAIARKDSVSNSWIQNIGEKVNMNHSEFAPVLYNDTTLLYSSVVFDTSAIAGNKPKAIRKILVAKKEGNTWVAGEELNWGMNTNEAHTSNACFSPDGKKLYFTRCYKNWQYKTICKIFVSEYQNLTWQEPAELNPQINLEGYTTSYPAVGINPRDNSEILYFVSDRPEGKGGLDIWYCKTNRRSGTFEEPRNAGRKINSYGDEITPFVHPKFQTLYFSSNGHPGFGGYDIFQTTGSANRWTEVTNLGKPFNSSFDDLYYSLNKEGNSGFLTSNRTDSRKFALNSCCDDIYYFNKEIPRLIPAKGLIYNSASTDIYELLVKKFGAEMIIIPQQAPVVNVPVFLSVENEEGEEVPVQNAMTRIDGQYFFSFERDKKYDVLIKNYGYFDKRIKVSTEGYHSTDTFDIGKTGIHYIPEFKLTFNIFYKLDESKLTSDDKELLDTSVVFLLNVIPHAVIEIGSHTDHLGTDKYNIRLSQKRAENVVKYLESVGIRTERLVARGYGETQPVAPNTYPDGTDNPEGRQKNRRTEIRIVGTIEPEESESDVYIK